MSECAAAGRGNPRKNRTRTCRMYGPPCECKGKVSNEESLRQCIRPLGGEFSPGLDEIRRVPVLGKDAGLVWAISASRFQVRRFDCSFIFTDPVQTSVGRTEGFWLLSLLIQYVPRELLD